MSTHLAVARLESALPAVVNQGDVVTVRAVDLVAVLQATPCRSCEFIAQLRKQGAHVRGLYEQLNHLQRCLSDAATANEDVA